MIHHHPSASINDYLLPLINGTSFFGRILGGMAADKIGRLNLLYPMTCLSGIFCLTMWLPADNVTTVISFVCLYGFSSGIFISVTPAVVAQLSPDDKIGARIGAFFTLAAIATLIGTPIAGTIIDQGAHDPYKNLILFAVRVPEPREDPARHETYLHSIGTYTYDRRTFPTCCPLHVRKESSHKALKCIETTELATWNDRSWRANTLIRRQDAIEGRFSRHRESLGKLGHSCLCCSGLSMPLVLYIKITGIVLVRLTLLM